jgi:predicted tellurium resistance membrane protein TerC
MLSTYITCFLVLTVLELVLGIDNIIFISIVSDRLPKAKKALGRNIGLALAMLLRIALLFAINWIVSLENPLIALFGFALSGKDLILLSGGIFLLYKTTIEIHKKMEGEEEGGSGKDKPITVLNGIIQITVLNIVFSFDSILTAVGLVTDIKSLEVRNIIMIGSVIASMILMMIFSGPIADFVNRHPSIKMLALSFLMMIGVLLVGEAFHFHVEKSYVYFAMAFSFIVELLNLRMHKKNGKH